MVLLTCQRFGQSVLHAAGLKASRNFLDVFSDRIRQAAVEPTLIAFGQKLCDLVQAQPSEIGINQLSDFMAVGAGPMASATLRWIRENHTLFAVLCAAKREDAVQALKEIPIEAESETPDRALPRRAYQIKIKAKCTTPLTHGADGKSGNATLFRRMSVLGENKRVLLLPFYAGNAIRGQCRDILADHFTERLGLTPRRDTPPWNLWFFHALYAGGALEEKSSATAAIAKTLGDNGAVRSDGVREFRDMLPGLSLLGCALGNRVLNGYADFGDWRPLCAEWNNGSETPAAQLLEWLYLTRREDHEDHEEHHGMIAITECLKAGIELEGGIDLRLHVSDFSRAALGVALTELRRRGRIGAQNRADYGQVEIECENLPDPEPYEKFLVDNKAKILDYLNRIGAIHARDDTDRKRVIPARARAAIAAGSSA